MKLLGIDYGSKRVGIALSDEAGQFAMPFTTLKVSKSLVKEVIEIAQKNGVTEIIIGESKNYSGEANPIMTSMLEFKKSLETLGADIAGLTAHLEPEFMTSHQAERTQHTLGGTKGKNGKDNVGTLDASAAAIILQSFLDKRQPAR